MVDLLFMGTLPRNVTQLNTTSSKTMSLETMKVLVYSYNRQAGELPASSDSKIKWSMRRLSELTWERDVIWN